jgi:hypothetical protein
LKTKPGEWCPLLHALAKEIMGHLQVAHSSRAESSAINLLRRKFESSCLTKVTPSELGYPEAVIIVSVIVLAGCVVTIVLTSVVGR